MRFRIHTPTGVEDHDGDARYQVDLTGGGVLAVWTDDGRKVVHGPGGWIRVEELAPPPDTDGPA